jgi:hypothetical protein
VLGGSAGPLPARSRRPAWDKANALRDQVEVIVGEPVPAQAQLPGQGPLAEPLAACGRLLADNGGVAQQAGIRVGAVTPAIFWPVIGHGGPDDYRHRGSR